MHKITVSLGNIDGAIRQIEEYEKKVQEKIKEFLTRLLEDGADIAKAKIIELKAIETVYNTPSTKRETKVLFSRIAHTLVLWSLVQVLEGLQVLTLLCRGLTIATDTERTAGITMTPNKVEYDLHRVCRQDLLCTKPQEN